MLQCTKFTGHVLKQAIAKYLHYLNEQNHKRSDPSVIPHGKQSVKKLVGQNQGVECLEINDKGIQDFQRIARRYGVDYAITKDKSCIPPKYLVFFKARDGDALNAAFSEYTAKQVKKAEKPSLSEQLGRFVAKGKDVIKARKDKERER